MTAGPARRAVLAVGALVVLGGCTGEDRASRPPRPHPEVRLRARIAAEVDDLVSRYESTLAGHPALSPVLAPLLAEHRAHVAALRPPPEAAPASGSSDQVSPSPTAPSSPTNSPSTTVPLVSPSPAAALAAVVAAETAAAARRRRQAAGAPPASARLLASVAAAEAAHAALLRRADA